MKKTFARLGQRSILPRLILLIGLFTSYQGVANMVRALSDTPVRYPPSIPFVK